MPPPIRWLTDIVPEAIQAVICSFLCMKDHMFRFSTLCKGLRQVARQPQSWYATETVQLYRSSGRWNRPNVWLTLMPTAPTRLALTTETSPPGNRCAESSAPLECFTELYRTYGYRPRSLHFDEINDRIGVLAKLAWVQRTIKGALDTIESLDLAAGILGTVPPTRLQLPRLSRLRLESEAVRALPMALGLLHSTPAAIELVDNKDRPPAPPVRTLILGFGGNHYHTRAFVDVFNVVFANTLERVCFESGLTNYNQRNTPGRRLVIDEDDVEAIAANQTIREVALLSDLRADCETSMFAIVHEHVDGSKDLLPAAKTLCRKLVAAAVTIRERNRVTLGDFLNMQHRLSDCIQLVELRVDVPSPSYFNLIFGAGVLAKLPIRTLSVTVSTAHASASDAETMMRILASCPMIEYLSIADGTEAKFATPLPMDALRPLVADDRKHRLRVLRFTGMAIDNLELIKHWRTAKNVAIRFELCSSRQNTRSKTPKFVRLAEGSSLVDTCIWPREYWWRA